MTLTDDQVDAALRAAGIQSPNPWHDLRKAYRAGLAAPRDSELVVIIDSFNAGRASGLFDAAIATASKP